MSTTIIGIYGPPGAGKSTLLKQLKRDLNVREYLFFEGSEVLAKPHARGLDGYEAEPAEKQQEIRKAVITYVHGACLQQQKAGIVTGHLTLAEEDWHSMRSPEYPNTVTRVYSHVIYLDVPADELSRRQENHASLADGGSDSVPQIQKRQEDEKRQLRNLCLKNGIVFAPVSGDYEEIKTLVQKFARYDTQNNNTGQATQAMSEILGQSLRPVQTIFVIDGDKTLAPQNSDELLWQSENSIGGLDTLKQVFNNMGHGYNAYHQLALLNQELSSTADFEAQCDAVAKKIMIRRPQFLSFLDELCKQKHFGILVLTCGLQRIWDKVLKKFNLHEKVKVIGAGGEGGLVMTPETKASVVRYLQEARGLNVWAFGSRGLDLQMLKQADQAIVLVTDEEAKREEMEAALEKAFKTDADFRPRQLLLSSTTLPLLDSYRLPIIDFKTIQENLFGPPLKLTHATDRPAAKLLLRNPNTSDNELQRVGFYLATEFVSEIIGLEEYNLPETGTKSHRLLNETETAIIPLDGGKAMAFGVAEVFPSAVFVKGDVGYEQVRDLKSVILVGGGEDSGKMVERIRRLNPIVRVVVVAGVVKEGDEELGRVGRKFGRVEVVGLRMGE